MGADGLLAIRGLGLALDAVPGNFFFEVVGADARIDLAQSFAPGLFGPRFSSREQEQVELLGGWPEPYHDQGVALVQGMQQLDQARGCVLLFRGHEPGLWVGLIELP